MQTISSHKLLTQQEEVELSKKVQDFIKVEKTFNELSDELGREPSMAEWAAHFGQEERAFRQRVEAGSAVCF